MSQAYWYKDTDVPVNFPGIYDKEKLEQYERKMTAEREAVLFLHPIPGDFDRAHLQRIHAYLFQDVYLWAGKLRMVDMFIGKTKFLDPSKIRSRLSFVHRELARHDYLRGMPYDDLIDALCITLANLNKIHPFLDGNGRAQRIFLIQLAGQTGYRLDFAKTELMVSACAEAMAGDYDTMRHMMRECISKKETLCMD